VYRRRRSRRRAEDALEAVIQAQKA